MGRYLAFFSLILYLGPVIRFRKHRFFYFFFIMLTSSPIFYLIRVLIGQSTIATIPILTLILLYSYPLINIKIKIVLSFPVIISFFHLIDFTLISFIAVEVIYLYLCIDLIYRIYNEVKGRHRFFLFELALVYEFFMEGFKIFIYYYNIKAFTDYYVVLTLLSDISPILITYVGPYLIFKTKTFQLDKHNVASNVNSLTNRELEVLKDLANGLTSKAIAEKLFISLRTVESHRSAIKQKLNCRNKAEIIKIYQESLKDHFSQTTL